jgi:hypothetical protein
MVVSKVIRASTPSLTRVTREKGMCARRAVRSARRIKRFAMSEYQYYEFAAIDRPLNAAEREQLRAISSRARITTTTYNFGDLKADPLKLLARYFDLFLYVANWGTRWFAMRVPKRLMDLQAVKQLHLNTDVALIRPAGEHVIISVTRNEVEQEEWDDGSGHVAALAPLRAELLSGDLRRACCVNVSAVFWGSMACLPRARRDSSSRTRLVPTA